MKALTASIAGGGSILCSHRFNLAGSHQLISFNQFPPLNLRRSYSYVSNQDHFDERPKSYLKFKFVIARAADSSPASVPAVATGGKSIVEDNEFSLAKVSFGVIGLGIGLSLLSYLTHLMVQVTEDGKYCLVLVFEAKALELADFEKRQENFASFFGPGISTEVVKGEEESMYDVRLISNTTL